MSDLWKTTIKAGVLALSVAGAAQAGEYAASVRDVPWYKAHPAERRAKLAACDDNPGVGRHDPECTNADRAAEKVSSASFMRRLSAAAAVD